MSTIKELQDEIQFIEKTRNAVYNIRFINSDGDEDETQLTVDKENEEEAAAELELLFADFCEENDFDENKILDVEYVGMDKEAEYGRKT